MTEEEDVRVGAREKSRDSGEYAHEDGARSFTYAAMRVGRVSGGNRNKGNLRGGENRVRR